MADPLSSVQHTTTRVLNRLTGLLLRAIGYGTSDSASAIITPSTLADGQMWAEMASELRIQSIAREA